MNSLRISNKLNKNMTTLQVSNKLTKSMASFIDRILPMKCKQRVLRP